MRVAVWFSAAALIVVVLFHYFSAFNRSLPAKTEPTWTYGVSRDDLRGTAIRFATIESENRVDPDIDAEQPRVNLTLFERRDTIGVSLSGLLIDCQSLPPLITKSLAYKLDNGPVEEIECRDDGDVVRLDPAAKLGERLATAERLVIEIDFPERRQQMTFLVRGLQWPPDATRTPT